MEHRAWISKTIQSELVPKCSQIRRFTVTDSEPVLKVDLTIALIDAAPFEYQLCWVNIPAVSGPVDFSDVQGFLGPSPSVSTPAMPR